MEIVVRSVAPRDAVKRRQVEREDVEGAHDQLGKSWKGNLVDGDEARHRHGEVDKLDQHRFEPLAVEAAPEPPYAEDDERPRDDHQQDS